MQMEEEKLIKGNGMLPKMRQDLVNLGNGEVNGEEDKIREREG